MPLSGSTSSTNKAKFLSERLAELAAQDFPGGRPWHRIHETHFSRLLIVGEPLRDEGSDGDVHRFAGCAGVPQNNKCARNLSCRKVRFRDHATITDGGMFEEYGLNLRRRDWEPFVLDHFLSAIEYVIKIIHIAIHDVPGPVPPVSQSGGSRLWRF